MAERIQPGHAASQVVDDFKLVDGIGPAVEKRLHAAGIQTYEQLARSEPERLAKLLEGMIGYSTKRIEDQDWSGQAQVLAEQAEEPIPEEIHEAVNNGLHYASYTLELLIDHDNQVHSTRAMHVQTRQESRWAGWDTERLQSFLVDSGKLQIALAQEAASTQEKQVSEIIASSSETSQSGETSSPETALQGIPEIVETRLMDQSGQPIGILIPGSTPFEVQLMLDLSQVKIPKGGQLSYDAIIYIKEMGKRGKEVAGRKEGTISADKSTSINVSSQPLNPGGYHLEALVALRQLSEPKSMKNQLTAMIESMPLHVF